MTEQHLLQLEARLASDRGWYATIVVPELIAEVRRRGDLLLQANMEIAELAMQLADLQRQQGTELRDEQEERA